MKINRSILAATALLVFTGAAAFGLTVPVQQDSTATNGNFLKGAGRAATLSVSAKQAAYVQFNLFDIPTVPLTIQPGNITSANLRIFVGKAKVAGDLELHAVTAPWSEDAKGAAPAIDPTVIATFPAAQVATKDFVIVDVTAAIQAGLAAPTNGFAIIASGATKVTLGAKEGAASGYPCELNIESNTEIDGMGTATFSSIVSNNSIFAGGNINAGANGTFGDNLILDTNGTSDGTFAGSALVFGGGASGEGIASGRTGGNQFGLDFYTSATNRLSITNGGSIGIGTSTPTDSILDVEGDTHINDFDIFLRGGADRNHGLGWYGDGKLFNGVNIDGPVLYGFAGGILGTNNQGVAQSIALYWNSSSVGIGTTSPAAKLDVRGDVKLGSSGQLFAPGGQENLRFVRGAVGGAAGILAGAGFTVARTAGAPTGDFTITWTTPFTGNPTATVSPIAGVAAVTANVFSIGTNAMRVQIYVSSSLSDQNWNFIAVGPR